MVSNTSLSAAKSTGSRYKRYNLYVFKSSVFVCTYVIITALFVAEAAMDGQAIHTPLMKYCRYGKKVVV